MGVQNKRRFFGVPTTGMTVWCDLHAGPLHTETFLFVAMTEYHIGADTQPARSLPGQGFCAMPAMPIPFQRSERH